MIQLTDSAVDAMRTAIQGAAGPVKGLRIVVESGCSGLTYMMGLVSASEPEDITVEQGGLKLFFDPDSERLLDGATVDFVTDAESCGFTFDNPNSSRCRTCGKSCG